MVNWYDFLECRNSPMRKALSGGDLKLSRLSFEEKVHLSH